MLCMISAYSLSTNGQVSLQLQSTVAAAGVLPRGTRGPGALAAQTCQCSLHGQPPFALGRLRLNPTGCDYVKVELKGAVPAVC